MLCGSGPADCICDYAPDIRVMEYWVFLVSRLEIEDLSLSSAECYAAAENLSSRKPAHENDVLGVGNIERLAVHFLQGQLKVSWHTLRYGVGGLNAPYPFTVAVTPLKIAGSSHKALEYFAVMRGVKSDKAHSAPNVAADHFCVFICDFIMCHVTPPDKHIGIIEYLLGQSLTLHIEICAADGNIIVCRKEVTNAAVYSVGIYLRNGGLELFVAVFVPDKYVYHSITPRRVRISCLRIFLR